MKSAVLIFTKVPKAGKIKTRLTIEEGGIFTPEEACELYEACLLDVIDCCIAANAGDVFLCYDKDGDVEVLKKLIAKTNSPESIKDIYPDQGGSFDVCIQYAADKILKKGQADRLADSVLIIGGDMPTLQPSTVQAGVQRIEILANSTAGKECAIKGTAAGDLGAAIVEGPCQEGGFSIAGFTCTTPFDFHGVFYNSVAPALVLMLEKAMEKQIPFGYIDNTPDMDFPVDVAGMLPSLQVIKYAAQFDSRVMPPRRLIALTEEMGLQVTPGNDAG